MAAFSYSIRSQLNQNIYNLYQRRRAIAKLMLTHDEYIATFVPAPARQLFKEMQPYNGHTGYATGELDLTQFGHPGEARLFIRGDKKAAPPLVRGLELQPDAPPEVVERIKVWLENDGDVHRDFARVRRVLEYLCENYSRAALRHYWPTIMALCDNNEYTKGLIQDLQVMRPPSALKPLPHGVAVACRKTASTISTAQLIPDGVTHSEIEEVGIETVGNAYKEDGLGTFYGDF